MIENLVKMKHKLYTPNNYNNRVVGPPEVKFWKDNHLDNLIMS